MKILKKRITKDNMDESIIFCRHMGKAHNDNYEFASELLDLIVKDKMIIHVYKDNTFEFKQIRKLTRFVRMLIFYV